MKLIYSARGGGKTTRLIKEAKRLKGYNLIICRDRKEAMRLWKEIVNKKYNLPQPITFDEFVKGRYQGNNINAFLIDNVDMLLQYIAGGVKIHAITFTGRKKKNRMEIKEGKLN